MRIVINRRFGGFDASTAALQACGYSGEEWVVPEDLRTDPRLIAFIDEHGSEAASGCFGKLEVVEIPEEATDYEVADYDGMESITYVVDGRIHHI